MRQFSFLVRLCSTFFYVGYLPLIPGTFASLAGILLYFIFSENLFLYILLTLIMIFLGFLTTGRAERMLRQEDARCIVIDEISGLLLSLTLIPPDIRFVILAFLLFRILDALKPYPASIFHRLKGSLGIMGDDIVAGLYTNIILQIVLKTAVFKLS